YKDDHNKIAYLGRERGCEDFTDILSYLDHSPLRYALTHAPPVVFDSLVKQFWATAVVRLNAAGSHDPVATIDGREVVVTESLIRTQLHFDDANGIFDMPNSDILEGMRVIGYPTDRALTFLKHHLSPQWRFLVHTLMHCLSPKSGGWNQFPSSIAIALICLSTDRVYNFSRFIMEGMIGNVKASKNKFLMYPKFLQMIVAIETADRTPRPTFGFSRKLFANMKFKWEGQPMPLTPPMLAIAAVGDAVDEDNAAAHEAAGSTAEAYPEPHSPPVSPFREPTPERQPETEWVVPNPVSPFSDWRPWPSVPAHSPIRGPTPEPASPPIPPAQTFIFEEPLVFGTPPRPAEGVDPDLDFCVTLLFEGTRYHWRHCWALMKLLPPQPMRWEAEDPPSNNFYLQRLTGQHCWMGDAPATEGECEFQDEVALMDLSLGISCSGHNQLHFILLCSSDVLPHADNSNPLVRLLELKSGKAPCQILEIPAEFTCKVITGQATPQEEQQVRGSVYRHGLVDLDDASRTKPALARGCWEADVNADNFIRVWTDSAGGSSFHPAGSTPMSVLLFLILRWSLDTTDSDDSSSPSPVSTDHIPIDVLFEPTPGGINAFFLDSDEDEQIDPVDDFLSSESEMMMNKDYNPLFEEHLKIGRLVVRPLRETSSVGHPFILMMCIIWSTQDDWVVSSWKLYPKSSVHVLDLTHGKTVYMFVDKVYPIRAPLLERMLHHRLTVPPSYCRDVVLPQSLELQLKNVAASFDSAVHRFMLFPLMLLWLL
ncbi:hypothetical protein Tco_0817548, partial [Tanacetum coccineum]